jgi:hypothetical protein
MLINISAIYCMGNYFLKEDIMGIIIGLGTGRSGSLSLAKLINSQNKSICFHEINPSCVKWSGTKGTILNMIREFSDVVNGGDRDLITIDFSVANRDLPLKNLHESEEVSYIGEVAFYYLNYVENIIKMYPDVRFPCIRRNKLLTVESYSKKMLTNQTTLKLGKLFNNQRKRNHFMHHDGRKWAHDSLWDKCYPKFEADTLEEAIGLYWESYYQKANELAQRYEQVEIFDLEDLNTEEGQAKILKFCNYTNFRFLPVHENKIR